MDHLKTPRAAHPATCNGPTLRVLHGFVEQGTSEACSRCTEIPSIQFQSHRMAVEPPVKQAIQSWIVTTKNVETGWEMEVCMDYRTWSMLVGGAMYPSWKIWVSQLGSWHSHIWNGKKITNVWNHQTYRKVLIHLKVTHAYINQVEIVTFPLK